jgi:hypothetical protein
MGLSTIGATADNRVFLRATICQLLTQSRQNSSADVYCSFISKTDGEFHCLVVRDNATEFHLSLSLLSRAIHRRVERHCHTCGIAFEQITTN